jgi:hypothetical protein
VAMTFTQTDTNPGALANCYRSDASTVCTSQAEAGAAAGSGTCSPSHAGSESAPGSASIRMKLIVGAGITWSSGTWTFRVNITSANMNITWNECQIERVNSSDVCQGGIGIATGLAISLGSTGVKSANVSGSAQTPSVGDYVIISMICNNGAMTAQSFTWTSDQDIDSPFTAVTQSLLYDPLRSMRPHLVRKVRDFFLGGLPPKLAKLRMKLTDSGLWLPSNDPQFRKVA